MAPEISTAIIAGLVSLVIAAASYIANKRALRADREKHERDLQRRLTEKLLDLRMESYPYAFEITDKLLGEHLFHGKITAITLLSVHDELSEWNSSKAGFLLSNASIEAYYQLRDALKIAKTTRSLSKDQIRTIWRGKNQFRRCLRSDVRLLYSEEEPIANSNETATSDSAL
jgi:hypothetical protein